MLVKTRNYTQFSFVNRKISNLPHGQVETMNRIWLIKSFITIFFQGYTWTWTYEAKGGFVYVLWKDGPLQGGMQNVRD